MLEFLLVNHPLDCPVCDKGGECPLQDQTLAYGPGESRFVEEKRHFAKPIPICDLVLLDRERCIQCARCTRFAAEVAGEALIDFVGRGDQIEVGTFADAAVLARVLGQHRADLPGRRARPPAVPVHGAAVGPRAGRVPCTTCAVGCRVAVQSSANRLVRLLGIDFDAGEPELAVRQGSLRLRGGQRENGSTQPLDRRGRERARRRSRGPRRRPRPPTPAPRAVETPGADRRDRRRAARQRGRLRLGQAGQGRHRHRLGRRPARRRAPGRSGARPAPRHDRRPAPTPVARARVRRPARGAAGAVPAPARGRGRRRRRAARDRPRPTALSPHATAIAAACPG